MILGREKSLENLKSFNTLTPSERSKITSKGGKASGKARRKKADLKQAMETILSSDVTSDQARESLESLGFEPTNEMLLAFKMFQQAANGNVRAFEAITKVTNVKDKHDTAEQKERIKTLKLENKRKELELQNISDNDNRQVVFLNESNIED